MNIPLNDNITLNSFRALLGKVNDGNVVRTTDGSGGGVRKANYGNAFMLATHKSRQVTTTEAQNREIRDALMTAIVNSQEGRSLSSQRLNEIRRMLGLADGQELEANTALSRRTLKEVLDRVDSCVNEKRVADARAAQPARRAQGGQPAQPARAALPAIGNLMIARQKEVLVEKGFNRELVDKCFKRAVDLLQQCKAFNSPAEMAKLLPELLNGHPKKDLTKFIMGNFKAVQSMLIDKMVWMLMDFYANKLDREEVNRNFSGRKAVVDVLDEMMRAYGERREPMPRAFTFLAAKTDALDDRAGNDNVIKHFLADLRGKCEALFGKYDNQPVTDNFRQLRAFGSQVVRKMLDLYKTAYDSEAADRVQKDAAGKAAVGRLFATFGKLSAAQLSAMRQDHAFKEELMKRLVSAVAKLQLDDQESRTGVLTDAHLASVMEELCRPLDLRQLAEAHVQTLGLDAESSKQAVDELVARLDREKGGDAETVAKLRVALFKIGGESAASGLNLLAQDVRFRTIATSVTNRFVSPEAELKARNEAYVKLANVPNDSDPGKLRCEGYIRGWEDHKTGFIASHVNRPGFPTTEDPEKWKDFFDGKGGGNEQVKQLSQAMPRIREIMEDKVFAGKILLINYLSWPANEPYKSVLNGFFVNSKFDLDIDKNENESIKDGLDRLNERVKVVNDLVARIKMEDLRCYEDYISSGLSEIDKKILYHRDVLMGLVERKPVFKLVKDGAVDFTKMNPQMRSFFCLGIVKAFDSGADVQNMPKIPENLLSGHVPVPVRRTLVDAVRQFLDAQAKKLKLDDNKKNLLFAACRVSDPPMDDNEAFEPQFLAGYDLWQSSLTAKQQNEAKELLKLIRPKLNFQVLGWGTDDAQRVLDLFASVGIRESNMHEPDNWMTMFKLQYLVKAHGGSLDGVVEWTERVTGKALRDVTLEDCFRLMDKAESNETIADPFDQLKDGAKSTAMFLGGTMKTSEAKFRPDEMLALHGALRQLESGNGQSGKRTVTLFGVSVELSRLPNGALTASLVQGGKKLSLPVARRPDDLIRQIENAMVADINTFGAANVAKILPPLPGENEEFARPRELYAKVLSNRIGLPSVHFAHLDTTALREAALRALGSADPKAMAAEFSEVPQSYNSAEAVELQEKYMHEDEVSRLRVVMPAANPRPTLEQREGHPPGKPTVHDFVADLFMNKDTWAFDADGKQSGERLRKLVVAYAPEIRQIQADGSLLDTLPQVVRENVRTLLSSLQQTLNDRQCDIEQLQAVDLVALESSVSEVVESAMGEMQAMASRLFVPKAGADTELWKKSLDDVSGAGGLDPNTPGGKFNKYVLDNYFVRCSAVEKRAMLSALIRNTDDKSSEGLLVAQMLKGAGPLLQKTLQGLPAETFGPETQIALKDMKSKLLPIPDSVIQAQLLEVVKSSKGEILSIEVEKSIGQATVGQALLCRLYTKDHPKTGEEVVIKLLRPNVQSAVQREHSLFMELAKELDLRTGGEAQQKTFEGRYKSILEEFDFTLEAENVDLGGKVYEKPTEKIDDRISMTYTNVHSMGRHPGVKPMTSALILQKVDGKPVDRIFEDLTQDIESLFRTYHVEKVDAALKNGPVKTVYQAKDPSELVLVRSLALQRRDQLVKQRDEAAKMLDSWLSNALFGDGVFHNDLHPGNVMANENQITVIDFGNVKRLSKTEQQEMGFLITAAMTGSADNFVASIKSLLTDDVEKNKLSGKAIMANLGEVLAKGSPDDVLPRLLGGLSILQQNGISVPETMHNFVQSLARLETVLAGYEGAIRDLEEMVETSVSYTEDYADTLRPQENDTRPMAFGLMDEVLLSIGDPNKPHDPQVTQQLQKLFAEKMKSGELAADFDEKIFGREGGGIPFLVEQLERYTSFSGVYVNRDSGFAVHISKLDYYSLTVQIRDYEQALKADPPDPDAISAAKAALAKALAGWMNLQVQNYDSSSSHVKPAELVDFKTYVGNSLMNRTEKLCISIGGRLGVTEENMRGLVEDNNIAGIGPKALLKLKALRDGLTGAKQKASTRAETVKAARGHADAWNAGLDTTVRLNAATRRILGKCAHEVRLPTNWKGLKAEDRKNYINDVLKVNLAAACKALGKEALSEQELTYFARLFAAECSETGFVQSLADPKVVTGLQIDKGVKGLFDKLRAK